MVLNTIEHSQIFFESMMKGPVGKFAAISDWLGIGISRFTFGWRDGNATWRNALHVPQKELMTCFNPDTKLTLKNNISISIKQINIGDILTFGCAISFAAHVIFQDRYLSMGTSISKLFLIQMMVVTLFSCMSVFAFEGVMITISERLVTAILVTGILATFVAIMFMVWAQTILDPNQTAILLSLESVFAALFSTFFAGEILGLYGWIGGMIVVFGVISSEISFSKKTA